MKRDALRTYWNPKLPVTELPGLQERVRRKLIADGLCTVDKLDHCPKERLLTLGYSEKMVAQIREAMAAHRRFVEGIAAAFHGAGLNIRQAWNLWAFDLLSLSFSCAELGYILRWQQDVAGRYGEAERFCVAGGRMYYCTECPYRDERSNLCGVCLRHVMEKEGKPHGV